MKIENLSKVGILVGFEKMPSTIICEDMAFDKVIIDNRLFYKHYTNTICCFKEEEGVFVPDAYDAITNYAECIKNMR